MSAPVGIVTVSYGSGEALEVFLSSLREFHGENVPVAVVDNKPDAENVQAVARRYGASYVAAPQNPGYGGGMNLGVRHLHSVGGDDGLDAYFFCNPDLRFIEPTLGPLVLSLMAQTSAGSIGPRQLNTDGTVYPSARNIPSVGTGVGHALFSKIWPTNPWTRRYQNTSLYDSRRTAGSISGAAVMVKRTVFEELGGWDENYFMHFEDIDLGYRIGLAGYQNIYDPVVSVEHVGAHSTKKHAVMVEKAMTESAVRFMRKRYAGAGRAPLRWTVVLGLRARGVLKVQLAKRSAKAQQ